MIQSHEQPIVWQRSYDLTKSIYKLTKLFPKDERFCFIIQMRRAALSIPSNIAEGRSRYGKNEFRRFCYIAYGSANELQTQIKLAKDLKFAPEHTLVESEDLILQTIKLLNALCLSLR